MIEVIPAIIPESFEHLSGEVEKVRNLVNRVQIDIVDGNFAPPKTWPFNRSDEQFEALLSENKGLPNWRDVEYELDMMVKNPEKYVDDWIRVGVNAVIIHDGTSEIHGEILKEAHDAGIKVGFGAHPSTGAELLMEMAGKADFIQLMGSDKIGYHGVELDEKVYEQARALREAHPNLTIAVDIGVDRETAPKLVEAGANKLVSGSAIFDSGDIKEAIDYFQNL